CMFNEILIAGYTYKMYLCKKIAMVFNEFLLRIGCAFLLGMAIGLERQYRQHNAGLRTNVLVSIGAAAFTVLSYSMVSTSGDPSRVAAQIVSGIGFLGGGIILKDGFSVRGINTAATIWCSAACGTLSGVGMFSEAFVVVIGVLATHCLLRPLCLLIEKKTVGIYYYTIHAECKPDIAAKIQQMIMNTLIFDRDVKVNSLFYKNQGVHIIVNCDMQTIGDRKALLDLIVSRLRTQEGVSGAGWNKLESAS
ncbi:MAG: MgtC/SapB family protein, partial [Paraprevotella sp.]|nr:MgtC/SapB family protein [Paraprevotella sp.]